MPLLLATNDQIFTNDLTLTDDPAVRIIGHRVTFTNSDGGRVISLTNMQPAIVIEGNGATIINQAGGIIRIADPQTTSLTPAIQGSSGNDTVINYGFIGGIVSLGAGNDEYHQRDDAQVGFPNANVYLGDGDDTYFSSPSASGSGYVYADGGAGVDRLVFLGPRNNFGGQLTSIEILDIRTNGSFEGFTGLQRIEVMFTEPGNYSSALRFINTPDADVFVGGVGDANSTVLSIYDRATVRSITGNASANRIVLGNDTVISGAIALGEGNDDLSIIHSQFSNPVLQTIGSSIEGGIGNDTLSLQLVGGDLFNASNLSGFERVTIFNVGMGNTPVPPPNYNITVSHLSGVEEVRVLDYFSLPGTPVRSVTIDNSLTSASTFFVDSRIVLNLGTTTTIGRLSSSYGQPSPNQVANDLQSMFINNSGNIVGDVKLYIGDDVFDGRLGTVGGIILSYAGNDTLLTDAGSNYINAGSGRDTIRSGVDNDILIGGLGADTLDGGSGNDTASYAGDVGGVFVNLATGLGSSNAAQGDTLFDIENLTGTDYDDAFVGTNGINILDGGRGNDQLLGGLGADQLIGGTGSDTANYSDNQGDVFVNLSTGQGYNNAAHGDIFNSIENLTGGAFRDVFVGDNGINILDGGDGNDYLIGGLGADQLIGNSGNDTVSYEDNQGAVFINMLSGLGYGNAAQGDTLSSIENLVGTAYQDVFIGDNGENFLNGAAGNDTLSGNGGADQFRFGLNSGVDTITDFVSGADKIALDGAAFVHTVNIAFISGTGVLAATTSNSTFLYHSDTGILSYDADGNGSGGAIDLANIGAANAIGPNDFMFF